MSAVDVFLVPLMSVTQETQGTTPFSRFRV
jgi:hypothetical protein